MIFPNSFQLFVNFLEGFVTYIYSNDSLNW